MRGQWLGSYSGNTTGKIMINIDDLHDHYEGVAYLHPDQNGIPSTVAYFTTEDRGSEHSLTAYTFPIDPRTGFQTTWEEIKGLYPEGVAHSRGAKTQVKQTDNCLTVSRTTDIGVVFSAELARPDQKSESKISGQKMSWNEFKNHVSKIPGAGYIFRGQKKPWKLCTSFHRRGRYRISEFTSKDVKQLHQRLSAITSHLFDLSVPVQNGAFFLIFCNIMVTQRRFSIGRTLLMLQHSSHFATGPSTIPVMKQFGFTSSIIVNGRLVIGKLIT